MTMHLQWWLEAAAIAQIGVATLNLGLARLLRGRRTRFPFTRLPNSCARATPRWVCAVCSTAKPACVALSLVAGPTTAI